jgi:hypothetical protein
MEIRKVIAEKSTQEMDVLSKILLGAKSWVFVYGPETKLQSSKWHTNTQPQKKKLWVTKSQQNIMLITFFNNLSPILSLYNKQ